MNIDELNTNADANAEVPAADDALFATPVSENTAPAPEPTVDAPAPTEAPAAPVETPAPQVETPATPEVPATQETPAAPEVTETPAPAEVPTETPVPTEAPAADIPAPTELSSTPGDANVDTLSPEEKKEEELPEEPPAEPVPTLEEIIANPTNVSEINTVKRKGSEGILILCVAIFAIFAFFMGDIIGFIEPLFKSTNPVIESNSTGDSSISGYLKIDDGVSEKTIENLRIYNVGKRNQSEINFTYISTKKIKSIDDLNIYIEVYNSNREILYKNHFAPNASGETGTARIYSFKVNKDIYDEAFYIDLKIYTEEDINAKTSLTCTRTSADGETFTATYSVKYNFVNNGLKSYDVEKSVSIVGESPEGQQYINEMSTDNDLATKYGITTQFENNKLNYTVDLDTVSNEYIPLYTKETTRVMIVKKESAKDWICK